MHKRELAGVFALLILFYAYTGFSEDYISNETSQAAVDSPEHGQGVNIDAAIASIYNFRGLNVFQASSQHDRHGVFSPSISWSIIDTGIWLKYAGYYQIDGDNQGYMVNVGRGHEQDLFLGWDYAFKGNLVLGSYFAYYFYPFSMEEMTGIRNPSYLEPAVGLQYSPRRVIDLGLNIAYYHAVQQEIEDERYVYFNPTVHKLFDFGKPVAFELGLSFGCKLFNDKQNNRDNIFDVDFAVGLPITITPELYINPAVHLTWTDLYHTRLGDEYFIWFGINAGVNL